MAASQQDPNNQMAPSDQNNGLFPAHFQKGALIQLADGEIKCVEDLTIEDFQRSTQLSSELKLDSSVVIKIDFVEGKNMALLCFVVGPEKLQITVEAPLEHPFFVYGKGWSSVRPEMSAHRYNLPCCKLSVGDICASFTLKQLAENMATNGELTSQQSALLTRTPCL